MSANFIKWFFRSFLGVGNVDKKTYNWQYIGSIEYGRKVNFKVPRWVYNSYKKTNVHHDGLIYNLRGKNYKYKIVESGQGAPIIQFFRKKNN